MQIVIVVVHTLFLSTLSLRRATLTLTIGFSGRVFLSTLSLRRATSARPETRRHGVISIHALLAESDQATDGFANAPPEISIHALLAESDSKSAQNSGALLRI